jgi:hypothetical protein
MSCYTHHTFLLGFPTGWSFTTHQRVPVIAVSTLAHASSALVWGSMAILKGLPKISGRGGNEALEGPGSLEVVLLLALGLGAAPPLRGPPLHRPGRQV